MKNVFCYSYATCAKKRLKKLSETIKEELLDALIDIEKKMKQDWRMLNIRKKPLK